MDSPNERPKVLFVDDEASILKGFKLNFGRIFDLYTSVSGRDALQIADEQGPFEVIVSDFSMPLMNGAEFLERIREQDREVVTILLTGQADFGDVCAAVEKGGIFRLLAKPCHPDVLKKNIDQALQQYRLIRAEKELLEQTLGATLNVLSSLLAASKPKIYRRAQRVEELAKQTVRQMKLPGGWRAGVAAKFSYLGFLTIPDEFQEKAHLGQELPESIQAMIDELPAFVGSLLKDIPRMKKVSEIVMKIGEDYHHSTDPLCETSELASIIRLCRDYDILDESGVPKSEIFDRLRRQQDKYPDGSLDALASTRELDGGLGESTTIDVTKLKVGNRILEDLKLVDGSLFAPAGSRVTPVLIKTIENYTESNDDAFLPQQIEVLL